MIRLAIVDDDARLSKHLRDELLNFPEITSVACYNTGMGLVKELGLLVAQDLPHVVIMDISMRYADEGIRATQELKTAFPQIGVVMFTISDDDDHIFEAFKAGAMGYLLKAEKPSFIIQTVVEVKNGRALMSPSIALKTIQFLAGPPARDPEPQDDFELTAREIEILQNVSKGLTSHEIGDKLFISAETVKKHIGNIYKKLQVKNKIQAIVRAKKYL